jgi:prepilin-type N-terminal cleavage/methylation domain-containing protein
MSILRRRRSLSAKDEGTTLIELLVVMVIFSIILGVITTTIISMLRQSQRENGLDNDLDASRKVVTLFDHSARYANAITTPGVGTDGSTYVEWQTGNTGLQQTCTQWRYVPTGGLMQYRTWQPPLSGLGAVTAPPWITAAIGMSQTGATPVWAITSGVKSDTSSIYDEREELTVTFTATSGSPSTSSSTQLTLTAINSAASSPPTPAVCTQVGRP